MAIQFRGRPAKAWYRYLERTVRSPIIISRGSSTICEPTVPNRGISRQSIRTKSKNSARLGAHTWKNSESWPRVVTENRKPEGRNPKEIRSPNSGEPSLLPAHGKFGDCPATNSDLGIRVSFGLRVWNSPSKVFDAGRNCRRLARTMILKPQLKSPSLTGAHADCMVSWRRMTIYVRRNGRGWD